MVLGRQLRGKLCLKLIHRNYAMMINAVEIKNYKKMCKLRNINSHIPLKTYTIIYLYCANKGSRFPSCWSIHALLLIRLESQMTFILNTIWYHFFSPCHDNISTKILVIGNDKMPSQEVRLFLILPGLQWWNDVRVKIIRGYSWSNP